MTAPDQASLTELDRLRTRVVELERDRDAALEQQTATADVLRIISSSPSDVQPVLDALVEHAKRLFRADSAFVLRTHDGIGQSVAGTRTPEGLAHIGMAVQGESIVGRAVLEREPVSVWGTKEELLRRFPGLSHHPDSRFPQARMAAPLLRDGEAIGAIRVTRAGLDGFTDAHVALLETFASQAVIAIENARLFGDLTESLEHQRATSEVLEVISRAPADLQAVVDAIVSRAATLTGSDRASLSLVRGDDAHTTAFLEDGRWKS